MTFFLGDGNVIHPDMKDQVREIREFFDQYASGFNRALRGEPNVEHIASAFAEHFIEASSTGITAGSNSESFREAISGGLSFYRSIGVRTMDILSSEVTLLDQLHALVKVRWKSVYSKREGAMGDVEFDVFYLVQDRGGARKIFAYMTGEERKVLQELGLAVGWD